MDKIVVNEDEYQDSDRDLLILEIVKAVNNCIECCNNKGTD